VEYTSDDTEQHLRQDLEICEFFSLNTWGCVSKSFRTGRLERELQMVQLALCHYVQLYRYFVNESSEFCRHNPLCCLSSACCYFIIDTVRKLMGTPSYLGSRSV